ncbi:hypothetical protein JXI42_03695 [bacterium]|nr:hypothetical protein [bacterium]
MARKKRSFADKVAKGTGPRLEICPKCGEGIQVIKLVKAYTFGEKDSLRFKGKMVKVCKCNEKDVFG